MGINIALNFKKSLTLEMLSSEKIIAENYCAVFSHEMPPARARHAKPDVWPGSFLQCNVLVTIN